MTRPIDKTVGLFLHTDGSASIKKLMPIRGELSITAAKCLTDSGHGTDLLWYPMYALVKVYKDRKYTLCMIMKLRSGY